MPDQPVDSASASSAHSASGTADGTQETVSFSYVRVEFKGNRRAYFHNLMDFVLRAGEMVIVQVEKGEDIGQVNHLLPRLPENLTPPAFNVLRRATPKDLNTLADLRSREIAARSTCAERITKHGLEMKLVDVEYQFDGRKLTFFFTADGRVDFRALVKDLAATFRTRIELRQIGARDETRRFGGAGACGKMLCCAAFMVEFCPITTQMAKDQNLPLNPGKISGCCGRLKCCLSFEIDCYRHTLKSLPRWEVRLETVKGPAVVDKLDVFNCTVTLRYSSGETEKLDSAALDKILAPGFQRTWMEECPEEADADASLPPQHDDDYDYPLNPS